MLVDNTGERATAEAVVGLGETRFKDAGVVMSYLHGHANIGYGSAHNLVMHGGNTHYHLVLNPDAELAADALTVALAYMGGHPEVGVLAPAVTGPEGAPEFLCKRYPSLLDLALRGFAPAPLRRLFRKRLERYEMRDVIGAADVQGAVKPIPMIRSKSVQSPGNPSAAARPRSRIVSNPTCFAWPTPSSSVGKVLPS